MMKDIFEEIETFASFSLPPIYKNYVSQINENNVEYFYALNDIIERNTTYTIQAEEPNVLLIGQDGDLGFYLQANQGDTIFDLDLGALGSIALKFYANDIHDAIKRLQNELADDE